MDDIDAPRGKFVHWLVWNIEPKTESISKGTVPNGAVQGKNDFGKDGYGGLFCSSQGIVPKRRWLTAVARQSGKSRRFTPNKEGSRWVIQLCPAFEIRKARESEDFCSTDVGIYRYLRANDEIVYIGRGPITARLRSPERKMWDFHVIEYSIVPDPDDQVKWEDYWIERFKADHDGKRPFYNRVSGSRKQRESQT